MKKRIVSLFCIVAMLLCVLALSACADTETHAPAYVTVDINPAIELTTDENGKITSIYAANEDAQIMLYNESSVIGKDLDVAIDTIIDLAIKHGYLNEENKVVGTSVVCKDEKIGKKILEDLNVQVTEGAEELGLSVTTTSEGAYSLIRDLEAFKAAHPNDAAIQALSAADFKLALSASETGEVTLEAAVTMPKEEVISLLNTAHQKAEVFATESFRIAREEAATLYEKTLGVAKDTVYSTYYITHAMSHPTTVYYGPVYQMYSSSALLLSCVADAFELAQKMAAKPLSDTQIAAVKDALDLSDAEVEKLKNADGDITVASVEAYADKLFKGSTAGAEYEQMKKDLSAALTTLESEVKSAIENEFAPRINTVLSEIETLLNTQEGSLSMLPLIGQQINTSLADLKNVIAELKTLLQDSSVGVEKLRSSAAEMRAKADEMQEKIRNDLSEQELAELNEQLAEAEKSLSGAKAAFDQTLAEAEAAARNHLATRKESLKNSTAT